VTRSNRWIGLTVMFVLVAGLLTVWGSASPGQPPASKTGVIWEYKTDYGPNRQSNDELLNKLGQEGWELVAVGDDPRGFVRYVFKRPRRS
jgi:hypothetical protein